MSIDPLEERKVNLENLIIAYEGFSYEVVDTSTVFLVGPFFEYVIFSKFFFVKFSIFEYCKRKYLTLGSLFAIFKPWI